MAQQPTLCEVSYDSPWLLGDEDFYTPFRLPSANRSQNEKPSSFVIIYPQHGHGDDRRQNGNGPICDFVQPDTYFEFLRDYYLENSSSPITYYSPRNRGGTVSSPQLPPRSYCTVPAVLPGNTSVSPIHYDCNQANYPIYLPALSRLQHRDDGTDSPTPDNRLIWVDTLNAWVAPKKSNQEKPYLSFVNNPPYVEKLFTATEGRLSSKHQCNGKCDRYCGHMTRHQARPPPCICTRKANPRLHHYNRAILERRNRTRSESPSKRAQRKAYSTPLYNHNTQRKRFIPLSARTFYHARNPPSPSSPEDIPELDIKDTGTYKEIVQPVAKEKKEDPLADKLTEVFGKDTHVHVVEVAAADEEIKSVELIKAEIKEATSEEVVVAEEVIETSAPIKHEHSDHGPSKIVVANGSIELAQSVINGITSISVLDKEDPLISNIPKEPKRLLKRPQKESPVVTKDEQKTHLPKLPAKDEILVYKAPPKKPEQEKPKATVKVISTTPSPPKPKPKQKVWSALPKFELKSPKPTKKSAGLTKKKKEIIRKPQPLPVSLPETPPPTPPKTPVNNTTDTQTPEVHQQPTANNIPKLDLENSKEDEENEEDKRVRSPVKKKEKIIRNRSEESESGLPDGPDLVVNKQSSWIYGPDDNSEAEDIQRPSIGPVKFDPAALPTAPDVPCIPTDNVRRPSLKTHVVNKQLMPFDTKQRWGKKKIDNSYEDEQQRAELAERRRKRQMDMYARLKLRKSVGGKTEDEDETNGSSFEDYDFLAKYCIFTKTKKELIQHIFNTVDEKKSGWLDCAETMVALRTVNNKLTYTEEEYLYRVMEMTGYKVTHGADFKLFSILAALSTKISLLDSWMKNIIGEMDFKTLEMKLFLCKTLWECNVNHETNTISLEQVMIELRVGGVSFEHECQVRSQLGHLKALDLFDFLTYVPLFIMIHESVVENPLDDSRIK